MPRIILRNNIKTISFELVNLPANFYSFVSFSCRHENEIRFNLFVQQKYIRKYFIVDNLELERIGEEGFFSFFQSLYRYIYIYMCVTSSDDEQLFDQYTIFTNLSRSYPREQAITIPFTFQSLPRRTIRSSKTRIFESSCTSIPSSKAFSLARETRTCFLGVC